ncbi:MAG TPA: hypothetical protein VGP47_07910 [Parachlamydiaceae bacterium]|nr:hypothetical protein [Parachlamydiaceae bacterium]
MNLETNLSNLATDAYSRCSSAVNFVKKIDFTPDHLESYLACYSIFQSINWIYEKQTKELDESTWSYFNYAQAAICLTAGLTHLYITRKNIESNFHINEFYLDNEHKLPTNKKEVFIVAKSNSDNNSFMGSLNLFPAKLHSDLNKINSVYSVVFKQFSDIKNIEISQKILLEKGKIIKGLAILSHSNKNFIPFGEKDNFISTGRYPHRISEVELLAIMRSDLNKEEYDLEFQKRKQNFVKTSIMNDKTFKRVFSLLDKDAQIVLHCCNSGKGTSNIAEHISKLGEGREVIAPERTVDGCALKIDSTSQPTKLLIKFYEINNHAVTGLLIGLNILSFPPQFCSIGILLSNLMLSVRLALPISRYFTEFDVTNTINSKS